MNFYVIIYKYLMPHGVYYMYTFKYTSVITQFCLSGRDIFPGHKTNIWIKFARTTKPFVLVYSEGFVPDHFSPQTSWPALW